MTDAAHSYALLAAASSHSLAISSYQMRWPSQSTLATFPISSTMPPISPTNSGNPTPARLSDAVLAALTLSLELVAVSRPSTCALRRLNSSRMTGSVRTVPESETEEDRWSAVMTREIVEASILEAVGGNACAEEIAKVMWDEMEASDGWLRREKIRRAS